MSKKYQLKSAIDASSRADGDDVRAVKSALHGLGYYKEPEWGITSFPDTEMFDSIERFQGDHGLRQDRVMKPGGETENELAARSPTFRCPRCSAPHGGSAGSLCPDCATKEKDS